jgi:hypothetical protein
MRLWHEGVPGDTGPHPQFHFNPFTDEIQPFTDADYFSYMRGVREACSTERESREVSEEVSNMSGEGMTPDYTNLELAYRIRIARDRDGRFNREEQKVYNDTLIELEYGPGFLLRAHP